MINPQGKKYRDTDIPENYYRPCKDTPANPDGGNIFQENDRLPGKYILECRKNFLAILYPLLVYLYLEGMLSRKTLPLWDNYTIFTAEVRISQNIYTPSSISLPGIFQDNYTLCRLILREGGKIFLGLIYRG